MKRRILPIAAIAVLAGCAALPEHVGPVAEMPASWTPKATDAHAAAALPQSPGSRSEPWWRELRDPVLDELLTGAAARNLDVAQARARIVEARAAYTIAAASHSPTVTGNSRIGRRNTEPLGREQATSLFEATFDAQWELDLFGASSARTTAAQATVSGLEYARDDLLLSLLAEIGRNYVELRNAQQQLRIARLSLDASRTLATLAGSLRDAGLRSDLDVAQADSLTLSLESKLPAFDTAASTAIRRIETLLGHAPGHLDAMLALPQPIPVPQHAAVLDTPVAVLARRPDVRRAERMLASAAFLHRAAVADLYPKVSIGALFGLRDTSANASLGIGALSAGLVAPIFNAGRLRAESEAADARREQASLAYRNVVLKALEDVEASLVTYGNADRHRRALERLVANEARRVELALQRYRRGIAPFSDVLEAQRSLFAAQSDEAQASAFATRGYIALSKSIAY